MKVILVCLAITMQPMLASTGSAEPSNMLVVPYPKPFRCSTLQDIDLATKNAAFEALVRATNKVGNASDVPLLDPLKIAISVCENTVFVRALEREPGQHLGGYPVSTSRTLLLIAGLSDFNEYLVQHKASSDALEKRGSIDAFEKGKESVQVLRNYLICVSGACR